MIRALGLGDIEKIHGIHEKYYKHEFEFPDLLHKFLSVFVITDDNDDSIITAGGVRTITESVIITDKSKSVKQRREALFTMLDACLYTVGRAEYSQVHATIIDDEDWKKHLIKVGFKPCKGQFLYLNLGD